MAKKMVLGKGLASLIQSNSTRPAEMASANLKKPSKDILSNKSGINNSKLQKKSNNSSDMEGPLLIAVEMISANEYQPRKSFEQKSLDELSQSIKANGILQPLVVTDQGKGRFELIAGERRLRAAKMAGLEQVPVIVKNATLRDKLVMAIIENVQRSDLNCVDEALAYQQLMNDFNLTQEDVSKRIGKNRATIANFLRILKLSPMVLHMLQEQLLTFGHAKVLVSLKNTQIQDTLAKQIAEKGWSVRDLEKEINKIQEKEDNKAKKENDPSKTKNTNLDHLKLNLERKTGFHFDLGMKPNGQGEIIIKFTDKEEFNQIYEYLLR